VHRREFEYTRHGTQCLIASFDVVTGRIENPTTGDTRNEEAFVEHIKSLLDGDPLTKLWRLIVDNLNTHQSESLVRLVVQRNNVNMDLGV
jgi:putative transposase